MQIIKNPPREEWSELVKRPTKTLENIENTVVQIFEDVQRNGNQAVQKYTAFFDGYDAPPAPVSKTEVEQACLKVPHNLKEAISVAYQNIKKFHLAQKTDRIEVETMSGVSCWQEKRAIQKVGLYIPGGTAPLFSTVLMLAIPAQIAECQGIILCSPPNRQGKIADEILYAAQLCGVSKIFKIGGIQAIAAMTFGTENIPQVYKIFGPGNQFVTVAKQLATKFGVAIDMPAGPSELLVLADESANANYVAADLLSQAEHGADSQVILVSNSEKVLLDVRNEINNQLEELSRKNLAEKAINNSQLILIENEQEALDFINAYGPEHFIINCQNESFFIEGIRNAGSVFIGNYTPESAGDYASGTNHTLPTNGFSKAYSGVNLDSFLKSITFQKITEQGLQNIGPSIELMAQAEGLEGHKNAVSLRLNDLNK